MDDPTKKKALDEAIEQARASKTHDLVRLTGDWKFAKDTMLAPFFVAHRIRLSSHQVMARLNAL
jgi:hypothetical protein